MRLLYVGPGNPYLSRLLRYSTHVQVTSAPHWEAELARAKEPFDVMIFDRVAAPALTHGNFILIDTVAPNLPLELAGKIQNPRVVSPVANHPLTEGLNLGDLTIHEALARRAERRRHGVGARRGIAAALCSGQGQAARAVFRF